jgi:hypothetical protein
MKRFLLAGLLSAVLAVVPVLTSGLSASTLTVTSANDSGPGTLREMIEQAANGDEIVFDSTLASVVIVLTGGELVVDKDLRITGLGPESTILDANGTSTAIVIPKGTSVTVSEMTIQNGQDSGDSSETSAGIMSAGALSVRHCVIRNNHGHYGAGIHSKGALTITSSRFENNMAAYDGAGLFSTGPLTISGSVFIGNYTQYGGTGGAVHHEIGTATIVKSTFDNNGTFYGGAIFNQGSMQLTDSLILNNWAKNGGSALYNRGDLALSGCLISDNGWDGAIVNIGTLKISRCSIVGNDGNEMGGGVTNVFDNSLLAIENSTVVGNSGAAVVSFGGVIVLSNTTITGNSARGDPRAAGLVNMKGFPGGPGEIRLKNSIVAGNYSDATGIRMPSDCIGTIMSTGHNLIGNADECPGIANGVNGDVVGVDPSAVLESSIADNGGLTPTLAILPGSLATDYVPTEACTDFEGNPITTDQRGVARPQGSACDSGAFEAQPPEGTPFWKRQCGDHGSREVGEAQMQRFLGNVVDESPAFPECIPVDCSTFSTTGKRDEARMSAVREILALWLNVVSGRLPRSAAVSLPELTTAGSVEDAIHELERTLCGPASRSELAHAEDLARALNSGEGTGP